MGDLLGSLIWGAKSGQYCVIGGGSLHEIVVFTNHFEVNPKILALNSICVDF
jgi:hypothetical protein